MAVPLILAGIGAGMVAGGAVGGAKSGILNGTRTTWADQSGFKDQVGKNNQYQGDYAALAQAYANRQGPTLGTASSVTAAGLGPANTISGAPVNDAASQGMQSALAAKLMGQMNGTEPSLAQLQMQQGLASALKNQQAAAASMRGAGVNASLAMRNLGDQAASMRQGLVGQAAMARLAEQQGAMGQLGGLASGMRSQDLATAQHLQQAQMFNAGAGNQFALQQAQFNQQANMANAEAANRFGLAQYQGNLGVMNANDQMVNAMYGARQHANDSAMQGELGAMEQWHKSQAQNYQSNEDAKKRRGAFWGGIMGAGGNLMSMSDEEQKTAIKTASGIGSAISAMAKKAPTSGPTNMAGYEDMGSSMGQSADGFKFGGEMAAPRAGGGGFDASQMTKLGSGGWDANGSMANANAGMSSANVSALSDEDQKASIAAGSPKLAGFYDALKAYSYRYKDPAKPGAGDGEFVSPMAQDLEKTALGKSMVKDTPEGKIVDYGKGFGAMLAGQAEFHDRLKKVESALAARKGRK